MKLSEIKIRDTFGEELDTYARLAGQGVARGMEPWVPRTVNMFLDYDIDNNTYRVTGEAIGHGWRYDFPIHITWDDMLGDPVKWSEQLYYGFLRAFRNRECDPVPDNIILGEG